MLNETRAAAKKLAIEAIPGHAGPGGTPLALAQQQQLSDGTLDLSLVQSLSSSLAFIRQYNPAASDALAGEATPTRLWVYRCFQRPSRGGVRRCRLNPFYGARLQSAHGVGAVSGK